MESLTLRDMRSLSDITLRHGLVKLGWLKSLDIRGCKKLFGVASTTTASAGSSLSTAPTDDKELKGESQYQHEPPASFIHLRNLFTNLGPVLVTLKMSYTPIDMLKTYKHELDSLFKPLKALQFLEFTDIQEHTQSSHILIKIATQWCLELKEMRLVRESYTKDYIVSDLYTNVDEGFLRVDEAFVEKFKREYSSSCRCQVVLIRNDD
jgi:hypothetical protein